MLVRFFIPFFQFFFPKKVGDSSNIFNFFNTLTSASYWRYNNWKKKIPFFCTNWILMIRILSIPNSYIYLNNIFESRQFRKGTISYLKYLEPLFLKGNSSIDGAGFNGPCFCKFGESRQSSNANRIMDRYS